MADKVRIAKVRVTRGGVVRCMHCTLLLAMAVAICVLAPRAARGPRPDVMGAPLATSLPPPRLLWATSRRVAFDASAALAVAERRSGSLGGARHITAEVRLVPMGADGAEASIDSPRSISAVARSLGVCVVDGLEADSRFCAHVRLQGLPTGLGGSVWSSCQLVRTQPRGSPTLPSPPVLTATTQHSLAFEWAPAMAHGEAVERYELQHTAYLWHRRSQCVMGLPTCSANTCAPPDDADKLLSLDPPYGTSVLEGPPEELPRLVIAAWNGTGPKAPVATALRARLLPGLASNWSLHRDEHGVAITEFHSSLRKPVCIGARPGSGCCSSICWCWRYECCRAVKALEREHEPSMIVVRPPTNRTESGSSAPATITVRVGGLEEGMNYHVAVRGCNAVGCGPWRSLPADVHTDRPDATPPEAPTHVVVEPVWADGVAVHWDPPDDGGAQVVAYDLEALPAGPYVVAEDSKAALLEELEKSAAGATDSGRKAVRAVSSSPGHAPHGNVTGLQPNRAYVIRVRARNSAGTGQWSKATITHTTDARPPQPPEGPWLRVVTRFTDAVHVAWEAATAEATAPVTDYEVQLRPHATGPDVDDDWRRACALPVENGVAFGGDGGGRSCTVVGLEAGKAYDLRVRAQSAVGWGPASAPAVVTAAAAAACGSRNDRGVLGDEERFHAGFKRCAKSCWADRDCTGDCVVRDVLLSPQCAECHAEEAACTKSNCMGTCMWRPGGPECAACSWEHCRAALVTCTGLDEELLP